MGKSKRRKLQERADHNKKSLRRAPKGESKPPQHAKGFPRAPSAATKKKNNAASSSSARPGAATTSKPTTTHNSNTQDPLIPFDPLDRILVLGDGDLSFSKSLVETHGCAALLATTYDDEIALLEKYPQAEENKAHIVDEEQRVLHGVDATKLVQREVRKQAGGWERVFFNFPHVGGKSTDVNRQVRYNQEMLVSFFKLTTPLLAPHGTIIVTLFEGEPYTLWNIRDLARHSGLEVQRSFRFDSSVYPGYAHTRTLGNLRGENGWKGEDRLARSYIFQVKGAGEVVQRQMVKVANMRNHEGPGQGQGRKRKANDDSSDEDSDA